MNKKKWVRLLGKCCYISLCIFSPTLHASFIEATMGTAVVNDATAAYYNPAALTLLKNPQVIGLGSDARLKTHFNGESIQSQTGFAQSGSSSTEVNYYLPSFYLGLPNNKITFGIAFISNFFNNSIEDNSILRYAQSGNNVKDFDINPAMGIKINDIVSIGVGISYSRADILLEPITGFPSLNVPDSENRNDASANGWGKDIGILLKPRTSTLIGFNYRSAVTYHFSGTSVSTSFPEFISDDYQFTFWTPARSILTIGQLLTSSLGFIGTIQRIQWSIFDKINIQGIATNIGGQPEIVNAEVPYHFHNTWVFTIGSQYRLTQKWIVRAAATYNQSPGDSRYQIVNGDSIILGASMGYEIIKNIIIDGSYAHAFIKNENIHVNARNIINGVNSGARDGVSIKLTLNF